MSTYNNLARAFRELGWKETVRKLYATNTVKFGKLVGVDKFGNHYYENYEDYPYGQDRWWEPNGWISVHDADASCVPADWQMWLNRLTDVSPPEYKGKLPGSAFQHKPQEINAGSDAPYENNMGGVIKEFDRNLSIARPRAWGEGNNIFSAPHEEGFYTQPGHPLDKRNHHSNPSASEWTLKDTAEDLRRRRLEALKLDPFTTDIPSVAGEGQKVSGEGLFAAAKVDSAAPEEPTMPTPTFASAPDLTPEEEDALKASVRGQNARWLQERMVACAELIEDYGDVPVAEAEDAVQDARDELAAWEKQYAALKSAQAKI